MIQQFQNLSMPRTQKHQLVSLVAFPFSQQYCSEQLRRVKNPTISEQISGLRIYVSVHNENYSAIRKNEILLYVDETVNLGRTITNDPSHSY